MSRSTHQALADERNATIEIYINGDFFPRDEAKISVFDSGFLVGDGIWEGIRLHHGVFAHLDRHLDRLFAGAAAIALDPAMRSALKHVSRRHYFVRDMYEAGEVLPTRIGAGARGGPPPPHTSEEENGAPSAAGGGAGGLSPRRSLKFSGDSKGKVRGGGGPARTGNSSFAFMKMAGEPEFQKMLAAPDFQKLALSADFGKMIASPEFQKISMSAEFGKIMACKNRTKECSSSGNTTITNAAIRKPPAPVFGNGNRYLDCRSICDLCEKDSASKAAG